MSISSEMIFVQQSLKIRLPKPILTMPVMTLSLDGREIRKISLDLTAVSMCWMLAHSNSIYCSMRTIILSPDILVLTRLSRLFEESTLGQCSEISLRIIVNIVPPAYALNHSVTSLMASSNNSRFWSIHGTPSPWISLSTPQSQKALQPSLLL